MRDQSLHFVFQNLHSISIATMDLGTMAQRGRNAQHKSKRPGVCEPTTRELHHSERTSSAMKPVKPVVRYGVVGVGLMGIEHIRNLIAIDGTEVTCIADNYPASIAACEDILQEEAPNADKVHSFTNITDMVSVRPSLCDVVIVSTPNHTHFEVLMSAYTLAPDSMNFLVEKPLCTTIDHCRRVTAAAKKRTGLTYVGLEYSYMPPIARIISDANKGVIGAPIMCSIREHRFPFLRKVRDWNRFNKNSGGTLVEKTCHFFDLFNRIFAGHSPINVFASGSQDVNHLTEVYDGEKSDIMDNAYVVINYTGGVRAMLDLCMFAEASLAQEEVVIVGDKGKLEAFLPQLEVRTGIRGKQGLADVIIETVDDDRIKYQGHHHGSSYLEHLDILKIVQKHNGKKVKSIPTAGLYQGLMAVAIGVAAQKSIAEGRVVAMTDVISEEELILGQYPSLTRR